jgi:taurine dioxygenase
MKLQLIQQDFAARVTDIDFQTMLNEEGQRQINDWLARYAVLVFPNQTLTPPQFMQAVSYFGELMPQQLKQFTLKEYPMVGYNSTDDLPRKNGKLQVRGENYHTDHSNAIAPPKATSLLAMNLPSHGGDTQFVDVRRAYDDLSADIKKKINTLRALHVHQSNRSPRAFAALTPEQLALIPQTHQPLIIRHPDSARSALYLNTGRIQNIEGLKDDVAFALIDQLYAHATDTKYEYRHQWQVGDLVIWDNRSVMHQANADYNPEEKRFLYRLMVQGVPLQPAFQ